MRIVIIGANGQLGYDLMRVFQEKNYEVIGLTHKDIEVADINSCFVLKKLDPDIIINTAAYHNISLCEKNPEKAFQINAVGARNIAMVSLETGSIVVYISTDYVFDGSKGSPYEEEDTPNPLNAYAISKLAGEFFTKYNPKHYIIRVASLFGVKGCRAKGGTNFVEMMISKAKKHEEIRVVNDVWMSPTYTLDAARAIEQIIKKKLPYGIYHVVNSGYCTWYEFAREIFRQIGYSIPVFPISINDYPSKVRRPKFTALRTKKLETYGIKMRHWKEALHAYLMEKGYI